MSLSSFFEFLADIVMNLTFCMLNSYLNAHFTEIITVFPQKIPRAYLPYRYTRGIYASLQLFYFSALSLFALLSRVFKLISIVVIQIQISHHLIYNKCIRQGTGDVDHGSRHVDDRVYG